MRDGGGGAAASERVANAAMGELIGREIPRLVV